MSECTHDCSSCSQNCGERKPESMLEKPHELSKIGKVIGVVSGKGGVGKSLVTSLLAVSLQRNEHKTAVFDADITGPSIPKMFGIRDKARGDDMGLYPAKSKLGTEIMSVNLLLENESDPVIWRGPVIAGVVKQFWTDVIWNEVDYMMVDMPPGTGDVPLTVFQTIPINGIIIVTTPQELVSMIVEKAVKMAKLMNVPILGIVENMSYAECPDCGKKISVFGESHIEEIAGKMDLKVLGKMPIDPSLAELSDKGDFAKAENKYLTDAFEVLHQLDRVKKEEA